MVGDRRPSVSATCCPCLGLAHDGGWLGAPRPSAPGAVHVHCHGSRPEARVARGPWRVGGPAGRWRGVGCHRLRRCSWRLRSCRRLRCCRVASAGLRRCRGAVASCRGTAGRRAAVPLGAWNGRVQFGDERMRKVPELARRGGPAGRPAARGPGAGRRRFQRGAQRLRVGAGPARPRPDGTRQARPGRDHAGREHQLVREGAAVGARSAAVAQRERGGGPAQHGRVQRGRRRLRAGGGLALGLRADGGDGQEAAPPGRCDLPRRDHRVPPGPALAGRR
mmetsp:Transcript_106853/g.319456  ORF Transcript_106853/g.319456 Transcript_106853/m.319456 type:complete len:278 (+) Transcript_106853:58-891(+)